MAIPLRETDADWDGRSQQPQRANCPRGALPIGGYAIPSRLPGKPDGMRRVKLDELVLDDSLSGVPFEFVLHTIRSLAPELLQTARSSRVSAPSPSQAFPSHLPCTVRTNVDTPLPTHILAIAFDDQLLGALVPIHGLAWALRVPALAKASTSTDSLLLPVIPMRLPSRTIFPLLHQWMYTSSLAHLLDSLLSLDPPPSAPRPAAVASRSTRAATSKWLRDESRSTLVGRLFHIHKLWETVVALEIDEPGLWETMGAAWDHIFVQLGVEP